ncbi:OmpW/AlkL family protein [Aestuariibacter salexigens]|uniref:OmpW/AlkL family protein n=1 Tax=Aestuariibacter salexigens TaxID=226010 RepID=UPI00041B7E62|nr:OmpW family outer membrane protein [Aestuariibacter salexigens]
MKKTFLATLVTSSLLLAPSVFAYEKGDIVFRAGLTSVAPDDSSSNIFVGGASSGADLGFGVNVDNNTQLGLNLAYFFDDQWNVELLAATPFKHDVNVNANPLGLGKLGEVTHLPPTVTVNYYFNDPAVPFQPYVGAGVNYTLFFDEEFTSGNASLGFSDLDLDASLGYALQAGFDLLFANDWVLNASVRYIDISTDAFFTLDNAGLGFSNASGSVSVDVDPYVYTVSVGYKF